MTASGYASQAQDSATEETTPQVAPPPAPPAEPQLPADLGVVRDLARSLDTPAGADQPSTTIVQAIQTATRPQGSPTRLLNEYQEPPRWVDALRAVVAGVRQDVPPQAELGAIAALMALLFGEQAVAAAGGAKALVTARVMDVSMLPLMLLFGLILTERFASMLSLA